MKRQTASMILIAVFLFTILSGTKPIQVKCEQYPGYESPVVTVLSPSPNATYTITNIPLNVTIHISGFLYHNMEQIIWLNYSLDGQNANSMKLIIPTSRFPEYDVHANDFLSNLPEGTHNLTIYGETRLVLQEPFNKTIFFKVDTKAVPIGEPFPTTAVATIVLTVAIICTGVGILVHRRKHK